MNDKNVKRRCSHNLVNSCLKKNIQTNLDGYLWKKYKNKKPK